MNSILLSSMLSLLLISNTSAFTSVKVKLHDTATLPCNHKCSGLVIWTMFYKPKPRGILALCHQTSCQSEEGFHMSHDQYLKGDLSLTITDVDYSKRALYTCECDFVEICAVSLLIEAVHVHKSVSPGESLIMDVPVSGPVEVTLNRTGDTKPNTVRLCEIRGREPQCDPEYEKRVSFSSSLQLKDLKESDSGVYTIWDTRNDDVIVTYGVIVGDLHQLVNLPSRVMLNVSTLNCNHTCSGLVTCTVSHNPRDILARCYPTFCQSEEGFHISHNQYLKGDLSLTITDVDYDKMNVYICKCDGVRICIRNLKTEGVLGHKTVSPGESLSMDVSVSDTVEMALIRTGDPKSNTVILCEIRKRELQCDPEYEKRVSISSSLQLKNLKESDSGIYIIRDTRNDDVIATYTVTVGASLQIGAVRFLKTYLTKTFDVSKPEEMNRTGDTNQQTVSPSKSSLIIDVPVSKPVDMNRAGDPKQKPVSPSKSSLIIDVPVSKQVDMNRAGDPKQKPASPPKSSLITDVPVSKPVKMNRTGDTKQFFVSPGESVIIDVPVSEPVVLILSRTGDTKPNTVRLCNITGRELECDPEYKKRVSFSSSLQLKDLKESDGAVYIIWDTRNDEIIATYTVTVGAVRQRRTISETRVKLHDTATLPCNHMCCSLVTWTLSHKPLDALAQCHQTSCWSQGGFNMSHDQYLKGDLSLIVTDVDYSKRTWYTCTCNSTDICNVSLRIEAVHFHKSVSPGESLIMDVPVSEPVELILNRTGDTKPNTVRLCVIKGRELQCDPEYEKRASFSSSLQLKDLNESDSGVYIIQDTRNKVIATYTVTVGGIHDTYKNVPKETGMWVLAVVLPLVLLVLMVVVQYRNKLQNCLRLKRYLSTNRNHLERRATTQELLLNLNSSNNEPLLSDHVTDSSNNEPLRSDPVTDSSNNETLLSDHVPDSSNNEP